MPATHINLRALRHPLTLASITILLINDHWLKAAAPSVLTGKLSDFTGLFFFPFLLAAPLSAARLPTRPTFLLALALTGGWFALMKTTVWANALTRAALSALWGGPVSIVLDPTDCWALVMLFPSWLLWRNLERERPSAARQTGAGGPQRGGVGECGEFAVCLPAQYYPFSR